MRRPFDLTNRQTGLPSRDALKHVATVLFFVTMSGCQFEEVSSSSQATTKVQAGTTAVDTVFAAAALPTSPIQDFDEASLAKNIPDWVAEAVFYQIFPERFRNGDPSNDPTRNSLEPPILVSETWAISPWTGDWYARADWERQEGENFYEHGVFNRRYGGDLQGILDKLDYLKYLGINTIYLNPVFYGRSLHKYDASSMHHIDPYFGPDPEGDFELIREETADPKTWNWTAADKLFLDLIQQAHQRDIRLIIDGVFNHTGRDFFAFTDILEKQKQSKYQDWYIIQSFDDPATDKNEFRYKSWWGFETLPEFADNTSCNDLHAGPKQYVFDITRRWMDPDGDGDPSDGIDGWRLDVANEVPMRFWRDWNTLVRELNPQAYTVGEFWGEARDNLIAGQFSGTMNYHGFAYPVKGYLIDGALSPNDFGLQLEQRRKAYPQPMQHALQNLIDSHDTDRLASMIVNARPQDYQQPDRFDFDVSERVSPRNNDQYDVRAPNAKHRKIQRLVALMQMTYLGAPMIYYGTEAGMWGADDPCDRMPMVWEDLSYQDQASDPLGRSRKPDPVGFDRELFDYYRQVIYLRHGSSALRRGAFELVDYDDAAGFFAFQRSFEGEVRLVAINRGETPFHWRVSSKHGQALRPVFATSVDVGAIEVRKEDSSLVVTLPALNGVVFTRQAVGE